MRESSAIYFPRVKHIINNHVIQTNLEIASPYQKKGPIIFLQVSNCKIDFLLTELTEHLHLSTTTPCKHFILTMIVFKKTLFMD